MSLKLLEYTEPYYNEETEKGNDPADLSKIVTEPKMFIDEEHFLHHHDEGEENGLKLLINLVDELRAQQRKGKNSILDRDFTWFI